MKKYKSLLPALLIMLFIVSGFQYEVKGQVEGKWNGNISLHVKYNGILGWSEKRINVYITDNIGSGSIKLEGETIIEGISMGKTSCSGAGEVELHTVVINRADSTYYIYTIGPVCSSGSDSLETGEVSIVDEPLGQTPNHLSGTKTTVAQVPGEVGTVTTTITWNLVRSLDVELIVTPQNYNNWLPEPGRDELTKGSVINISLKVQRRNGQPSTLKAKSFELHLSSTSKEPGITLNAPLSPSSDQMPDLRFLEHPIAESLEEDQFIKIDCKDGSTGNAFIASYDGGGWTTLTVEAILEDDTHIKGSLLVSGGEQEIRIPKRDIGSKIATAWLTANGNPGEMDDDEITPIQKSAGNINKGDGLTAYEEYRGVISEGKFKRLNPKKKEVGILASRSDFSLFSEGIGWFKNASGLEIVRFDFDREEIAPDGKLNLNAKSAHDYDQYALYLLNGGLGGTGTLGIVYSRTNAPDIPAQIISVVADWNAIQAAYRRRVTSTRPDLLKFTLQDYLAQTVAHELGHAVNIWHHGVDNPYEDFNVNDNSASYRIFNRNGILITDRPYTLSNIGFKTGTVESGDMSCMLNYYPYYSWGYTIGADGAHIFNQVPLLSLGKIFCKSKNATGINATRLYFGDADKGNCLEQIKLRN